MIDGLYNKVRDLKKKDSFVTSKGKVLQPEKAKPHHELRKKTEVRPEFDTRTIIVSELRKNAPAKVMHSPPKRESPAKKTRPATAKPKLVASPTRPIKERSQAKVTLVSAVKAVKEKSP